MSARSRWGGLTFREAAQIISQIAPALDAVHSQGIVHRDLKPGNILFDSFGNPTISDFGIAHFTAATSDLTGSAIIGTPSYMSPEHVRGEDLDGRSDVYALGVILFEMLAGRAPFYATTPLSVAFKHITDPIPSIRAFRPDLPIQVEFILNRALAKDREMRYPDASELARELRALLNTFLDNIRPASFLPRMPGREEASTEVDVDAVEGSQPAFDASKASQQQSKHADSQEASAAKVIPQESIDSTYQPGTQVKRPSRGILRIVAIAGIGLFLFILCGSLGIFGTWAGLGLPSLFSQPTQTPPPTLTAAPTENIADIVLFSDDFSDPLSGWPTLQDAQGSYSYQADGYHISASQLDAVPWARTNRQDQDISIYVDARPATESVNSYYGLLCRIQEDQSFYYFVIRSTGDYTIGKYKNAQFQSLFSEGWRRSDAIHQGMQTNRLRADCVGNILRISVNDVLLGEATDTDFVSGFSGLIIAALDPQGFEAVFNNFSITKPDQ